MSQTIEYKDENGITVARMNDVAGRAAAIVIAQKYMAQMVGSIDSATVSDDATEVVVSRATEWQKRN